MPGRDLNALDAPSLPRPPRSTACSAQMWLGLEETGPDPSARKSRLGVAGANIRKRTVHRRDYGRSNNPGFGVRLQDAALRPDCNARDRPPRSFEPSEVCAADS